MTMFLLRGLKSYHPSKFECLYFLSKTHCTFLLWLITFEPLEQKQSYISPLKVLICGMNALGTQKHAGIFILWYTSLKMALLLHKTALVNFPMATTVYAIAALMFHWILQASSWHYIQILHKFIVKNGYFPAENQYLFVTIAGIRNFKVWTG